MYPNRSTCSSFILVRVYAAIEECFPPPDSQVTRENQIDLDQLRCTIQQSLHEGAPKDLIRDYKEYTLAIYYQIRSIIEKCMSVIFGMQALKGVINWGEAAIIIEGVIHPEIDIRVYCNGVPDEIWKATGWMLMNGWGTEWGKEDDEEEEKDWVWP